MTTDEQETIGEADEEAEMMAAAAALDAYLYTLATEMLKLGKPNLPAAMGLTTFEHVAFLTLDRNTAGVLKTTFEFSNNPLTVALALERYPNRLETKDFYSEPENGVAEAPPTEEGAAP